MVADMSRFTVLLCRAQEAGNVGSACRAMKTMGILDLVLVDCPEFDSERVATLAVHAFDVYENAVRFSRLEDALAGFAISAVLREEEANAGNRSHFPSVILRLPCREVPAREVPEGSL